MTRTAAVPIPFHRSFIRSLAGILLLTQIAKAAPQVVQRWDFNKPDDAAGWEIGHHLEGLTVTDGAMRLTLTGFDAFLFSPVVEVPLDGCVVRIRLRGATPGNTQVYWMTSDYEQAGEQQVMDRFTPAGDFIIEEFRIGQPTDGGRTLTRFRIDPFNGNKTGTVHIDWVELIRIPPIFEANLAHRKHWVNADENVEMRVRLRRVAGSAADQKINIRWPTARKQSLLLANDPEATASLTRAYAETGVHIERVHLSSPDQTMARELETSVIVGRGDRLPLSPLMTTEQVRLDFVPLRRDFGLAGAARFQVKSAGGNWTHVGWLMPLAQLTFEQSNGAVIQRQPPFKIVNNDGRKASLVASVQAEKTWEIKLTLEVTTDDTGHECIHVSIALSGPEDGRLLDFSGPIVRVDRTVKDDPLDRYGLFGGLEFLAPGWRSSSERAVGPQYADRWSPHPFKITLPVMAVQADGVTCAVMWNPLQKWHGDSDMPAATFASPNFIDDQPNHLMKLSAPSIPKWREENESVARQPLTPIAGPVRMEYDLYAKSDWPIALTARRWYQRFGTTHPPAKPHDNRTLYDMIARNYGETMYWENERGWRQHWFHLETSAHFIPYMAAELIAYALETGNRQWVELRGLEKRTIIDTVGPLAKRFHHADSARAAIAKMRPDGTFPFIMTDAAKDLTRRISQGQYESLGEEGSTSLGTCVQSALPILKHAQLTADPKSTAAAIKALDAMTRFRIPRGAQTWEVHQQIPDIRAAALATEAFQIGYHITGDERWLDQASYWAWTGVPFVYSWHVPAERRAGSFVASRDRNDAARYAMRLSEPFQNPKRQVTPYGTLPVMGTSCYVVNWFGVIVQWCGLEWAEKVIQLDQDRPDPLLRYIADGVVLSGLQQVLDRPPWVGLYPDWWNLEKNIASGALINAMLPMHCLQAQQAIPNWTRPWTRVLRDAEKKRRWHVSGWGRPVRLPPPNGPRPWSPMIEYPPGQPNELIITGVDRPLRVKVADERLTELDADATPQQAGWRYSDEYRAVFLRFVQPIKKTTVHVAW